MVVDATVPTLVLLVVLATAVAVAHLGGAVLTRVRRAIRAVGTHPAVVVSERWCPRVVLIDDDRWAPATT